MRYCTFPSQNSTFDVISREIWWVPASLGQTSERLAFPFSFRCSLGPKYAFSGTLFHPCSKGLLPIMRLFVCPMTILQAGLIQIVWPLLFLSSFLLLWAAAKTPTAVFLLDANKIVLKLPFGGHFKIILLTRLRTPKGDPDFPGKKCGVSANTTQNFQ